MVFKKLARKMFAIYKYVFSLGNEKFIIRIFIIKLKGSLYIYIAMYLSAIAQVCFYWSSYAYTYVYIYTCVHMYLYIYITHTTCYINAHWLISIIIIIKQIACLQELGYRQCVI